MPATVTFSQSGTSARSLPRMRRLIPMLASHAAEPIASPPGPRGIQTRHRVPGGASATLTTWCGSRSGRPVRAHLADYRCYHRWWRPGIAALEHAAIHEVGDEADYAIMEPRHA